MRKLLALAIAVAITAAGCGVPLNSDAEDHEPRYGAIVDLPDPVETGVSVEDAIRGRDSFRQFTGDPLSQEKLARILWAAAAEDLDGVTGATRPFSSAGATYATVIYVAVGNVEDLPEGVYQYLPGDHQLRQVRLVDVREDLARAALNQIMISHAPVSLLVTADYMRTVSRYSDRGHRYVHIEAGAVMQNVELQAEALGLGATVVGAFDDDRIKEILETDHDPLLIIPIGHRP